MATELVKQTRKRFKGISEDELFSFAMVSLKSSRGSRYSGAGMESEDTTLCCFR